MEWRPQLDILVGNVRLTDRFEWDPHDTSVTPEEFARLMAADLCASRLRGAGHAAGRG